MDNKTKKELGFSMNELNENTIIIEGVVQGKASKKSKMKYERGFSKVSLHLFDKEYIDRLQGIEFEINENNKGTEESCSDRLSRIASFLMK